MSPPNVLWLTLESTRADHCSLSGYERETTPTLDALAAESDASAVPECHAHGIWTRSSSASILTGTYPTHHRVGLDTDTRLPDALETVPELLGRVGYDTACVSSNPNLSASSGLDRGFDEFSYLSASTLLEACGPTSVAKYLANFWWHSGGLTLETRKHPFGYLVNEVAKRRIDDVFGGDAPGFLYVHYPDTHHPYYPPKPYRKLFVEDLPFGGDEAAEIVFDVFDDLYFHIANGCDLTGRQWSAIEAMYDSMIRYSDDLVGAIVDYARSHSRGELAIVVTADHGELLGERDLLSHRFAVHSALSHVPLVVVCPDLTLRASPVVQHSDVVRTLLGLVGADVEQIQGVDLGTDRRTYAITQRGGARTAGMLDAIVERNPAFDVERFPTCDLTSVTDGAFRYEACAETGWQALYELPSERRRDVDELPAGERLSAVYTAFMADEGRPVTEDVARGEVTEEMREHLDDLGYL